MRRLTELISRFRRDERGVFMVLFAILALVLIATSGAVVDFTNTETARSRAQTALDAAALALQAQISTQTTTQLQAKAQSILTDHINDASITATVTGVTVDTTLQRIDIAATLTVPTAFVQLVGIHSITAHLASEATQGSENIEVGLALDITGSMAGSKLTSLQSAADTLIDLVVQTSQTPTFSKMAIIPWTNAVNINTTYASGYSEASVRGAVTNSTAITGASWSSGSKINISGISKANPGVITTSSNHGFSTGDVVYVTGVSGMTQVNGNYYTVTKISNTTFSIGVKTSSYSTYTSGGTVQKCQVSACQVVITDAAHGLANSDNVYITGVGGMTSLNNTVWTVASATTNTYVASGTFGPSYSAYTSGGASWCTKLGCYYYYFPNSSGGNSLFTVSDCVSERTGTHAYDDTAPSSAPLGYVYPASNNPCVTPAMTPLSSDKTALKATISSLVAGGSTAGQLGLAWGWYSVDPNFAYLWPSASQPKSYSYSNLIKAVVLMTDGDFNTDYCSGVISQDTNGTGSGNNSDHINCNSPNGASATQATSLCTAIKAKGIILYTVAFDVAGDTAAQTLLSGCATDSSHYFEADTGTDLQAAFQQIGENLQNLRISK